MSICSPAADAGKRRSVGAGLAPTPEGNREGCPYDKEKSHVYWFSWFYSFSWLQPTCHKWRLVAGDGARFAVDLYCARHSDLAGATGLSGSDGDAACWS